MVKISLTKNESMNVPHHIVLFPQQYEVHPVINLPLHPIIIMKSMYLGHHKLQLKAIIHHILLFPQQYNQIITPNITQ